MIAWRNKPYLLCLIAVSYLVIAMTKIALRTWFKELDPFSFPAYGITIGIAIALVGLTCADGRGLVASAAGMAFAALASLLLLALKSHHPELLIYAWPFIPWGGCIGTFTWAIAYRRPTVSEKSLLAQLVCLAGVAGSGVFAAAVVGVRFAANDTPMEGKLTWGGVVVGIVAVVGAAIWQSRSGPPVSAQGAMDSGQGPGQSETSTSA